MQIYLHVLESETVCLQGTQAGIPRLKLFFFMASLMKRHIEAGTNSGSLL
jgi:hypothetical protein